MNGRRQFPGCVQRGDVPRVGFSILPSLIPPGVNVTCGRARLNALRRTHHLGTGAGNVLWPVGQAARTIRGRLAGSNPAVCRINFVGGALCWSYSRFYAQWVRTIRPPHVDFGRLAVGTALAKRSPVPGIFSQSSARVILSQRRAAGSTPATSTASRKATAPVTTITNTTSRP